MEQGFLALVLHNHLPFVRHPEYEEFLEERWLFEAILETYLPLLQTLEQLNKDGVDYRITLSFSPSLLTMLNDPLLQNRFKNHLAKLLELGDKEINRTRGSGEYTLAEMYKTKISQMNDFFIDRCRGNMINLLKELNSTGKIELITCAATHGFLPFMEKQGAKVQIAVAVDIFRKFFNDTPRGMWLPECAYLPGLEEILKEYGIKYFFLETHGIIYADPPNYSHSVYAPLQCPNGVAVFGRDPESSKQVWSKDEGYPGDFNYREYYRDIGFDLPVDYISHYIHPDGIRLNTGFKYYKITGKSNEKELYNPWIAREKAAEHADNFIFNRQKQIEHLSSFMDRKPLVVAPFDGELFGHWWFEGPIWLDMLLRKIHYDQDIIKTIIPSEYLRKYPDNHIAQPAMSSWGNKGYFEVWLNGSNDWIYRHLHKASGYMTELARTYPGATGLERQALQQAARELLLAQASDWAFIIKTDTMVEYAKKRTIDHLGRFFKIYQDLKNHQIDPGWLNAVSAKNNIFPEIDYSLYASYK
ncbi:MAG: glycoside hydrolase family 57 protein [Peptococcaceae bacterium]